MIRGWIVLPAMAALLAACTAAPEAEVGDPSVAAVPIADGFEPTFVPSLAPRDGRPCGDIVGLAMSGPFTAAIIQLGESRSLIDATPEMIACAQENNLEVEAADGF